MAPHYRLIRQLEVGAGCLLAGIGLGMCQVSHWAKGTHIGPEHSAQSVPWWVIDAPWWVVDAAWLLGLLMAAVVGFRGGFLGSQITAVAAFLILLATLTQSSFVAWPAIPAAFLLLGALHLLAVLLVGLRYYLGRAAPENKNEMTDAESI